jgi:predicted RNA-binding Zn ribbon-like protein
VAQGAVGQYVFEFTGGRPCLDFSNTLSGGRAHPIERLTTYEDLVAWARQASVLSEGDARRLLRKAEQHPKHGAKALAEAIALREALYRIFSSAADDSGPLGADLETLNTALARALDHLRVARNGKGFTWEWDPGDALDRMLWPVVRSAADLLVSDDVRRVRRCGGENCDWLFLDTSRNHSRRWCSMRDCGNRAKARRYYARQKSAG